MEQLELAALAAKLGVAVEVLQQAVLLAVVANRLVEGIVKPLFERFKWDHFWLLYVSWGMGMLLVTMGEINLFSAVFPDLVWGFIPGRIVGIVLSGLIAGGGANLLHDIFGSVQALRAAARSRR